MADAPILPDLPPRVVACPECGVSFSKRGIAAHRRLRHGVAPAGSGELGVTLARIAEILERLESRLESEPPLPAPEPAKNGAGPVEPPPALPSQPTGRAAELRVLERGLREVLAEIARVKLETVKQLAAWGGKASSAEIKALEQTSYKTLGSLRRRQASLLFRLQEARGEDAIDNSLCL